MEAQIIQIKMITGKFEQKKKRVFYQILGTGLLFLTVFLFVTINLYPKLNLITKSLLNKLEVICGCANHLSFTNHPFIFTSLFLAGLALAAFLSHAVIKILKIKLSTNRFIKIVLKNKRQDVSSELKEVIAITKLENKVIEVNEKEPLIFCFGFLQPKICISSKLVQELNKEELTAALLHEKHHLNSLEPIKIFIIKTIAIILFFLPVLKTLTKQYLALAEITADQEATNNWQNKKPLAQALYKVIKLQEQLISKNNLAISFFTVTGERVNKLVDNKYVPNFKLSLSKILISVMFLLVAFASFGLLTYYSQPAMAHQNEFCSTMTQDTNYQCQMTTEGSECLMSHELDTNSCEYK